MTDEEKLKKIEDVLDYGPPSKRDYYVIDWPVTTRTWTFGTYVHEILENNGVKK